MRQTFRVTAVLLAVAACGNSSAKRDAAVNPGDDVLGVSDAPPDLVPDAYVPTCVPDTGTTVAVVPFITSGLSKPLMITGAPGDRRQFVIEQDGRVRVIKDGVLLPTPLLDLSAFVDTSFGEEGLLGIAMHPDWLSNGLFYLAHSGIDNEQVFVEYHVPAGSDVADPSSRRELLRFTDPYENHNGGSIEFGSDGYLYIAIGDGGSGGDPQDRAQNELSLFGKILRIDVDMRTVDRPYGIPATNPFASSADGPNDPRPEIWHKGLRNPFRFTFDRQTSDIYIGDVGQETWEEIDVSANTPLVNWGWDDREGAHCYEPSTNCATAGRTEPAVEHNQSTGWQSIIGGQVYRGPCYPNLAGKYFYGDYFVGELWSFTWNGTAAVDNQIAVAGSLGSITAIHDDGLGQLYVVLANGSISRVITQ